MHFPGGDCLHRLGQILEQGRLQSPSLPVKGNLDVSVGCDFDQVCNAACGISPAQSFDEMVSGPVDIDARHTILDVTGIKAQRSAHDIDRPGHRAVIRAASGDRGGRND